MIIGETFCWLHLGKTGGKTSREVISLVKDEKLKKIYQTLHGGRRIPDHHFNIEQYEKCYQHKITDRDILIGFRRLTTWIQSFHTHFRSQLNGEAAKKYYTKSRELSKQGKILRLDGSHENPDQILSYYISNLDINNINFIRCEYMYEDFLKYFGSKIDEEKLKIACNKKIGARQYSSQNFSEEEIKCIYEANPLWSEVESLIYKQ